MSVIRLTGFAGENRAIHPLLLPEGVGVLSRNQKPGRGDLRPWKSPLAVASVPSGRGTIYRMGRDVASDSQYWLSWTGVVHGVRGFDPVDTTERTYFTGDGPPKVTDNTMALATAPYPTASRPLGIPAPSSAPLVATDAGTWTGLTETRFYVYTYVNDWGWESAPSPVSAQNDRPSDATATISGFATVPAGNYNVDRIRIYRTQVTSSAAEFFFMAEVAIGTLSVIDANAAVGEVLPTTTWATPPDDLSFLTPLWNGMLAGLSGNAVRLCEAYVPYAWPLAYDLVTPDAKPVALGVFGQSLLVLTTGKPMVAAGSSPDAMDQQPLEFSQGCIAPRSVVSMGTGVAWASEDGLCWYGTGGARVLTQGLMTREDWQLLMPSSIVGKMVEGLYFGSYDDGSGRKGFLIDPSDPRGLYFLDVGYAALHFDELRDQLYVLSDTQVSKWDAGSLMTYRFRSKRFKAPRPTNFAAAEVVADAYPVTLRITADGTQRNYTAASSAPFRLHAGFMALEWQLEIESSNPVQGVAIATSMAELAASA